MEKQDALILIKKEAGSISILSEPIYKISGPRFKEKINKEINVMVKMISILKKEDGSVIVAALLILVLLTIIGISAVSTSNTELNITSNAQLHKMAFFMAESGWHVMADWLDDEYPLPTQNLGTDNWMAFDGIDNDGDGDSDEHDENLGFTASQYNLGSDGIDNDGDGSTDEADEQYDLIPFLASRPDYRYGVTSEFVGAGIAVGWDPTKFLRYDYTITSTGNVPARGGSAVAQITVTAGKIQEK
jgi:PilX N-terminal